MKPGVKQDLIFVVIFVVGVVLWFSVGLMLAPLAPPASEGTELATQAFWRAWRWSGMGVGCALVVAHVGVRARSGVKREDRYLSGKAVAVIASIFAAIVLAVITYVLVSND